MDVRVEVEVFVSSAEFNVVLASCTFHSLEIIVASSAEAFPLSSASTLLSSSGLGLHSPPGLGLKKKTSLAQSLVGV